GDIVAPAVAGEAAAEICGNSYAMYALRVGNIANDGVGVRVHHHGVSAVRDVNTAGGAIDVNVIPEAPAAHPNGFYKLIAGCARRRGRSRRKRSDTKHNRYGQETESEETYSIDHDLFSLLLFSLSRLLKSPTSSKARNLNAA